MALAENKLGLGNAAASAEVEEGVEGLAVRVETLSETVERLAMCTREGARSPALEVFSVEGFAFEVSSLETSGVEAVRITSSSTMAFAGGGGACVERSARTS